MMWAVLRWRDRHAEEPEAGFFDGFGRWEEDEEPGEPPPRRGGGS
ncbi:hypothetical protein ACFWBB_13635 [Streptomyces sp. NPDC060000]